MPELPEMETYRRALLRHLNGETIIDLRADRPRRLSPGLSEIHHALVGCIITGVSRRGKSLALQLGGKSSVFDALYVHLMLGGSLRLDAPSSEGPVVLETRHLAVVFQLGLGRVEALTSHDLATRWAKLGIEPLSGDYHPNLWREAYQGSRRSIKAILMDQAVVAGIGSVYSDEVLYRVGIHPSLPARNLTGEEWTNLGSIVPEVLSQAISLGGVGLPFYREDHHTGQFRDHLKVHYQTDKPCHEVGRVVQGKVSGRTAYWCTVGQRGANSRD